MASPPDILVTLYPGERDTEWERQLIQRCEGKIEIRWQSNVKPDGTHRPTTEYDPEIMKGATILYTYAPLPNELVPKLRFVHVSSAGSDLWHNHPKYMDKSVRFCTTSGSNAAQIAEWVIGVWLRFQHKFPQYAQLQQQSSWKTFPLLEVQDSVSARVGILGYGSIGRQVARVCSALGMDILAFTSTPRETPESRRHDAFHLPGLGDPEGTLPSQWFHGKSKNDVNNFLAQGLDMLVISLPLSRATEKLIGQTQLEILSAKKTFVVNIARGPIVDQEALIEALEDGKIRGAALDVTDPEPLPADHPLWKAKNCFLTPHVSWHSISQNQRCLGILADNVERFLKGQPLINELKR